MNKNKKIFAIILIALIITVIIIICYKNYKYNHSMKYYVTNTLGYSDTKKLIESNNDAGGAGTTLALAIEGICDWDNLMLSQNFKNKFVSGNKIMPERKDYESFFIGSDKINGEKVIVLFADIPEPIIQLGYIEPITYEYYYRYKLDNNNMLDDVELIKKIKTNSTTGEVIE